MTTPASVRRRTYAVRWRDERADVRVGKLELGRSSLVLEGGRKRGRLSVRLIRYADVAAVRMAEGPDERIDGHPTVMIHAGKAPVLAIASVEGLGSVRELFERLSLAVSGMLPA